MGAWLRLKSNVDVSRFGPQSQVALRALQQHGGIVADNGSSWFISGAPDSRWDNNDLHGLGGLRGSDFEFVDSSSLITDPDSGRVVTAPGPRIVGAPYWKGWDIARGFALLPDGTGGYTIDVQGGLHPFAVGPTNPIAPPTSGAAHWSWPIARNLGL